VTTVYLLAPGTRVAVSRNGAEFSPPRTLKVQLQFNEPTESTDTTMTFKDGPWRLRVDRSQVIVSQFNGQGGKNHFGV